MDHADRAEELRPGVIAESDGRSVAEMLARVYRRDDPLP
ncbi:hypothetical protein BH24ACT9_BH24ACT9_09140 [soil metagenome]|jgi:hypothetical protein